MFITALFIVTKNIANSQGQEIDKLIFFTYRVDYSTVENEWIAHNDMEDTEISYEYKKKVPDYLKL